MAITCVSNVLSNGDYVSVFPDGTFILSADCFMMLPPRKPHRREEVQELVDRLKTHFQKDLMDTRLPQEEEQPQAPIEELATPDELDILRYVANSCEESRQLDLAGNNRVNVPLDACEQLIAESWYAVRGLLRRNNYVIEHQSLYRTLCVVDEFIDLLVAEMSQEKFSQQVEPE